MFFLFIGGTELSKIPGVSAAGANLELIPFTAPVDADVIRFGASKIIGSLPLDPEGHPSPAIITRAAIMEADIPVCVVRTGSYIPPSPPYVELGAGFGADPRVSPAIPDVVQIIESAGELGKTIGADQKFIMIAESVPGGTTTALLILRALGYFEMVSSAGHQNPMQLKEAVWHEAAKRIGIKAGNFAHDPLRALAELGDPMQAGVVGFLMALPQDIEVVLAGGTQMLAVIALLRAMNTKKLPLVATTKYVQNDESSDFTKLASALGVKTWIAPLDFSYSPHRRLRDYELGYVKEGVGAGGSVLYAERKGILVERIITKTNELYAEMMEQKV